MLITIENFGAIKHFQFDTEKDLYLIFGKNSVGKSYAISLVYLILKNLKRFQQSQPNLYPFYGGSFNSMPRDIMFSIYNIISSDFDLIERESNDRAIETQVSDAIKSILHDYFVVGLESSIINTFSDISKLSNKSNKNNLTIKLHWNNNYNLDLSLIKRKLSILNCSFDGGDFLENLYSQKAFNSSISNNEKINIIFSYIKIIADITKNFSDEFVNNIYFFPASRSGLYLALSNFGQIYAQISSSGTISEPLQIATISEPVADYFLNLTTIKLSEKNNTFVSYAKEIEKNILKGTVVFDNEKKRLLLKPDGFETALDLSIVSSMESEISPIVYYLKYILSSNDIPSTKNDKNIESGLVSKLYNIWKKTFSSESIEKVENDGDKYTKKSIIFIEEPEAHLHPETQVKLMEIFAKMVKDNKIKLVMTSHSNYIFNKASNLVMDNKIDKEKFSAVLFEPTPEGSVAKILETDEYGIEDENFIDTAESIYEEKIDLINKLNG